MAKKLIKYIFVNAFLLLSISSFSQNLLGNLPWSTGVGNAPGFYKYGNNEENSRVYKEDHLGNEVVVWQGSPNTNGGVSGGFTSHHIDIDHTKTYRLSVWIKKTNSNDGTTQLKATSNYDGELHTTDLNDVPLTWQPFWYGDFPILDRWYLLVGYIHGSTYNSNVSLGKIYDGVTGNAVISMNDHKFKPSATKLQHRTILYGSSNTSDRQYMYAPRVELVNGNEMPLNELLSLNPNSTLQLSFDAAGNQSQRFYCELGNCYISGDSIDNVVDEKTIDTVDAHTKETEVTTSTHISIFPNPVKDIISIKLNSKDNTLSDAITVYNTNGVTVKNIKLLKQTTTRDIDLSGLSSGVYYIHLHLSNGEAITKKIIKN